MRINALEYLLDACLAHRERVAIETPEESITYENLVRRAYLLHAVLAARVPAPGCPVPILMKKSPAALSAIAATLISRNIYCPIDVAAPPERIAKILASLGQFFILADEAGLRVLERLGIAPERFHVFSDAQVLSADAPAGTTLEAIVSEARTNLANALDVDPCYIIFTSGSTGAPKGVTISHRGVIDYIEWANKTFRFRYYDKVGSQAPLFFDNSTLDLYSCWSNGACFHIIPEKNFAFPKVVVDHLARFAITTVFWVPSALAQIANLKLLDGVQLPHLVRVLFAGEVMPARTLRYWMDQHPSARYSNLYGPTEITVDCTYFDVPPGWDGANVPIGIPCTNAGILVLDEHEALADEGELCVRGSGVALGYWNDVDKSAAVFVQNPLQQQYRDIIYRTGDMVRREQGLLYFIGRKDQQIKHNGYRIELGEIEIEAGTIDHVTACVAGYDQERQQIYLAVVAEGLDRAKMLQALASRLPKYMLPARIEFLPILPLTPNRKFDRKAVHQLVYG